MPTDINNFNITNFNLERRSFTFCIDYTQTTMYR